jgi:hypothetical protein
VADASMGQVGAETAQSLIDLVLSDREAAIRLIRADGAYAEGWSLLAEGDAEGAMRAWTRAQELRRTSDWRET